MITALQESILAEHRYTAQVYPATLLFTGRTQAVRGAARVKTGLRLELEAGSSQVSELYADVEMRHLPRAELYESDGRLRSREITHLGIIYRLKDAQQDGVIWHLRAERVTPATA